MSSEVEIKIPELTAYQKFESKFYCPFEFYLNIGGTFSLIPVLTRATHEIFVVDWLWLHIGITYSPK